MHHLLKTHGGLAYKYGNITQNNIFFKNICFYFLYFAWQRETQIHTVYQ